MNTEEIINRYKFIQEYCKNNYKLLLNEDDIYKKSITKKSYKKRVVKLTNLIGTLIEDPELIDKLTVLLSRNFIVSPQSIGILRGIQFNNLVGDKLYSIFWLDSVKLEVCSEFYDERVDWVVTYKNKIVVGMNQLDLWGGGAQLNRAGKYILSYKKKSTHDLLCVIYNDGREKLTHINKQFRILDKGIVNNTLCYIENLENILKKLLFYIPSSSDTIENISECLNKLWS